ncbi:MAG: NUDIX domain-containing protein [Lachnospiraceae bacterium]|nr:NUDIX domain-containing protein [Lachnospiraceae bacterium]
MGNSRKLSASCIVIKDDKVLLVKHTYGAAKGKYLIPGGFSEEGEMPQMTAEREVLEETGVKVKAGSLAAVRFTTQEVWCIFLATYIEGEPASDNCENEEAVFMPIEEALTSEQVVETSRELVKAVLDAGKEILRLSEYVNPKFEDGTWQLFL